MAPVTRKRKPPADSDEKYTCSTCFKDKVSRLFPDYNPSPDCEHLITTCKNCLRKWIEAAIEGANFKTSCVPFPADREDAQEGKKGEGEGEEDEREEKRKQVWGIGCPECEGVMRSVNVANAVPGKAFKRFDELERRHIGETTPNWRWCLSPTCRGGQVHAPIKASKPAQPEEQPQEPPAKKRRKAKTKKSNEAGSFPQSIKEEDPDIFTCTTCSFRACARCDRPMHDGETCAAYRLRTKDRLDEENAALRAVKRISRPCPGCKKNIEKNGGCPSMICSQCNTNFCWVCLRVFERGGYCKCRPPSPPPGATTVEGW